MGSVGSSSSQYSSRPDSISSSGFSFIIFENDKNFTNSESGYNNKNDNKTKDKNDSAKNSIHSSLNSKNSKSLCTRSQFTINPIAQVPDESCVKFDRV